MVLRVVYFTGLRPLSKFVAGIPNVYRIGDDVSRRVLKLLTDGVHRPLQRERMDSARKFQHKLMISVDF